MTERRDRRGRRRAEGQERGLRPLHRPLPQGWTSRALRVSISAARWQRFEALIGRERATTPTAARAAGQALMTLMDAAEAGARGSHWLDWEREKTVRLLRESGKIAP